jgi:uncharacterized protein
MPSYKHPGVYIEEIPSGLLAVEAASTSTAAIIGPVLRGPVDEPVLINGIDEFVRKFGVLGDKAGGIRDLGNQVDHFGHAVNAFFMNGGRKAYIVRVANGQNSALAALVHPTDAGKALHFKAKSPGKWANSMIARLAGDEDIGYVLSLGFEDDGSFAPVETFSGASLNPADGRFLGALVKDSELIKSIDIVEVGPGQDQMSSIKAWRSGRLRGLSFSDLSEKRLKTQINTQESILTFVTPLDGQDAGPEEIDLNKIKSLAELAAAIQVGVRNSHDPNTLRGGFVCMVTNDDRLIMIPPPVQAENQVTIGNLDPDEDAKEDLKLIQPDGGQVSYPNLGLAEFFLGKDGSTSLTVQHYQDAFTNLKDYRDASILLLPGAHYGDDNKNSIIDAAISHAEEMKNRMVIVDPEPSSQLTSQKEVKDAGFTKSHHAVLYYPWLSTPNPHYHPETAANRPRLVRIAPSAVAAGVWARIDGRRGVWKAPAGLETGVRGVAAPEYIVGNDAQDSLNEWGVNCIRNVAGSMVVWGARTLATKVMPDFRYISVRRTSILIGDSLYNALQSVVFEPNNHTLWANLRANVTGFMDILWRAGAFQGAKASDAYNVRCGLEDTMTQQEIDAGIVRVKVAFAPLKPAEFVIVQIEQKVGQAAAG